MEFCCFEIKGESIEKNTDIAIKCFNCGNSYTMDMMRMGSDGKNLVCRNCLERKPAVKQEQKAAQQQEKNKEPMKEYFCKECKYSFTRARHISVDVCPYCGNSGTLMQKGSTARIIADASKMKDPDW